MVVHNPNSAAAVLQRDIDTIANILLVKFNLLKSESLVISRKRDKPYHTPIHMYDTPIPAVTSHTHIVVILSNDGSWHQHFECIKLKAWSRVNLLKKLRCRLDRRSLEITNFTFIRPFLEYAGVVWDNCTLYEKMS